MQTLIPSEMAVTANHTQPSHQRSGSWRVEQSALSAPSPNQSSDCSVKFSNSVFMDGNSTIDSSQLWKVPLCSVFEFLRLVEICCVIIRSLHLLPSSPSWYRETISNRATSSFLLHLNSTMDSSYQKCLHFTMWGAGVQCCSFRTVCFIQFSQHHEMKKKQLWGLHQELCSKDINDHRQLWERQLRIIR